MIVLNMPVMRVATECDRSVFCCGTVQSTPIVHVIFKLKTQPCRDGKGGAAPKDSDEDSDADSDGGNGDAKQKDSDRRRSAALAGGSKAAIIRPSRQVGSSSTLLSLVVTTYVFRGKWTVPAWTGACCPGGGSKVAIIRPSRQVSLSSSTLL